MSRSLPVRLSLTLLLASFFAVGCSGQAQEKLTQALATTVKSVTFGDETIEAVCAANATVAKVPLAELGLDSLGMFDVEKLQSVAKAIRSQCEASAKKEKKDAQQLEVLQKEAKKLRVKVEDTEDLEALRTGVCAAKAKLLPLKGERRADGVSQNRLLFGCPDPGEPEVPKSGYWLLETDGKGKKKGYSAKLDSEDDDGSRARLAFRCRAKKADAYFSITEVLHKTKNKKVTVKLDGKKTVKWTANISKDGKALFLKNTKKVAKDLAGKKKMQFFYYPKRGKKTSKDFAVDGFSAAIKPLKRACKRSL